jgi:UDP-arabinose 4-epimerase
MFVRYYHNITSNTLLVLESMAKHDVKTLIYSSTCATYGEPEKMPITEVTPQVRNLTLVEKNLSSHCILDYFNNAFKYLVLVLTLMVYISGSNKSIW